MVSVRECERVRAERDAMAEKVADHEALRDGARGDLGRAEDRRDEYLRGRPELMQAVHDAAGDAVAAQVTVLERRLEAVAVRRDDLTLTAPFDGVVMQIPGCPGQVVRPGDPVLKLTSARAEQIVVWLDEAAVVQAHDGRRLEAVCPVVRIGPALQTLPSIFWPSPNRPMRGGRWCWGSRWASIWLRARS